MCSNLMCWASCYTMRDTMEVHISLLELFTLVHHPSKTASNNLLLQALQQSANEDMIKADAFQVTRIPE